MMDRGELDSETDQRELYTQNNNQTEMHGMSDLFSFSHQEHYQHDKRRGEKLQMAYMLGMYTAAQGMAAKTSAPVTVPWR